MSEKTPVALSEAMQRFSASFGLFVGPGRELSVRALARATRIPESTLKSYLYEQATPGLHNLMTLCRVLPWEFADSLLEGCGLEVRPRKEAA